MYTDQPKNKLPRATGMGDSQFKLNDKSVKDMLAKYSMIPSRWKEAIQNPGETLRMYHEENGYEYEHRVRYDPETNSIWSTDYCPFAFGHHLGQTCSCCGLVD